MTDFAPIGVWSLPGKPDTAGETAAKLDPESATPMGGDSAASTAVGAVGLSSPHPERVTQSIIVTRINLFCTEITCAILLFMNTTGNARLAPPPFWVGLLRPDKKYTKHTPNSATHYVFNAAQTDGLALEPRLHVYATRASYTETGLEFYPISE